MNTVRVAGRLTAAIVITAVVAVVLVVEAVSRGVSAIQEDTQ